MSLWLQSVVWAVSYFAFLAGCAATALMMVLPPKPPVIVKQDPRGDWWVCVPYESGTSCKSVAAVNAFVLGNARDDCHE